MHSFSLVSRMVQRSLLTLLIACGCCVESTAQAPPPSADLEAIITADRFQVQVGETVFYSALIRNYGGGWAFNVEFLIDIPQGTTVDSISGGAGFSGTTCTPPPAGNSGTIRCTRAELPSHSVISMGLRLRVSESLVGTVFRTTVTVSSIIPDPFLFNNSGSSSVLALRVGAHSDLSVAASGVPNPVLPGQALTHSITVTNSGPDTAANVRLGLRGLEGSESTAIEVPTGWSCSPLGVIGIPPPDAEFMACTAQFFEPGSVVLRMRSQVRPSETLPLTLGLRLTSNAVDPVSTNNEISLVTPLGLGSGVPVPTLSPVLLAVLALLLATIGLCATTRRT